jgi:predicted transcriptional regulator
MLVSLRLKPEVDRLLKQACKSERRTRTAVIHEALEAYLKRGEAPLGEVIRQALKQTPEGFGIERAQPRKPDRRAWGR